MVVIGIGVDSVKRVVFVSVTSNLYSLSLVICHFRGIIRLVGRRMRGWMGSKIRCVKVK